MKLRNMLMAAFFLLVANTSASAVSLAALTKVAEKHPIAVLIVLGCALNGVCSATAEPDVIRGCVQRVSDGAIGFFYPASRIGLTCVAGIAVKSLIKEAKPGGNLIAGLLDEAKSLGKTLSKFLADGYPQVHRVRIATRNGVTEITRIVNGVTTVELFR